MRPLSIAGGLIFALTLAGCAGGQVSLDGALDGAQATASPAPKIDMNGRWMLAAPNAPSCGMRFGGAPGAQQGKIEPEGGCPGDFFTSRHWQMADGTLTIDDHENKPLGQLKPTGGTFAGKSTDGTPITLSRSSP